jgi:hypothetical protein
MSRIWDRQRQWILKDRRGLLEADAVLGQVSLRLIFVPLKQQRHSSMMGCGGLKTKQCFCRERNSAVEFQIGGVPPAPILFNPRTARAPALPRHREIKEGTARLLNRGTGRGTPWSWISDMFWNFRQIPFTAAVPLR